MALDPRIAQFRSSGVERLEFDKSQTVNIPAEQLRLVVGFSKDGPFNTPVFVPDSGFFKDIYGDIDRKMERKSSYFHRSCLAALERGPILALNLLRLNNDPDLGVVDEVEYSIFSTSATQSNIAKDTAKFSGFYNKAKFWFPEDKSFLNNISNKPDTTNKIFNLVNLGQRYLSVVVRKADSQNTTGFNVTAKEWYGVSQVPEFLHPDDYISDFMVDVMVFEGDFGPSLTDATPYERFISDPLFAKYFDKSKGLKRKKSITDVTDSSVDEFSGLSQVNTVGFYTGILIPDFIDLQGRNLFIQDIINSDTPKTGLFCSVNKEIFDSGELLSGVDGGLDLIGHNLEYEQPRTIDFLSYKETIKTDLTYAKHASPLTSVAVEDVLFEDVTGTILRLTANSGTALYTAISSTAFKANTISPTRIVGSYVQLPGGGFGAVINKTVTSGAAYIEISGLTVADFTSILTTSNQGDTGATIKYINAVDLDFIFEDSVGVKIVGGPTSSIYSDVVDGVITDGDKAVRDTGSGLIADAEIDYLDINLVNSYQKVAFDLSGTIIEETIVNGSTYYMPTATVKGYQDADLSSAESSFALTNFFDSTDTLGANETLIVQTLKGAMNNTIPVISIGSQPNEVLISSDYETQLGVGKFIVTDVGSSTGPSRMSRITRIVKNGSTLTVTCLGKVLIREVGSVDTVEVYTAISEWVDYYNIINLKGFRHTAYHLPDGTQSKQNSILGDTLNGTKLFEALIDKETITYRYIIDTFGLGIEANSKSMLTILAKSRQNAFAILNAPSIKDFTNSTDPSFVDLQGAISSKMISEGGDLSKNPTVIFSLPGIVQGSNYGAFFGPNLIVRDLGKNILVPPAAYVSNNFIDKYTSALPWSVVAGTRRGVVGGTGVAGVEFNFTKDDRDYLEPFGINPIITQSGTGIVIFGNKTAQQNVQSALSSINAREVLIYIQDGIAAILKNYLFEINTPQVRLEIKTLADNFLSRVQSDGGIYAYKNIMDESNNTSEVIDKKIGILDSYIEVARALEILVHRTTILKTGQIATGQFL